MKQIEIKAGQKYTDGDSIREVYRVGENSYEEREVEYCPMEAGKYIYQREGRCSLKTFARWAKSSIPMPGVR